jgi:ATP-dependent RNA circularization protein (DNA/RNA ligase family)
MSRRLYRASKYMSPKTNLRALKVRFDVLFRAGQIYLLPSQIKFILGCWEKLLHSCTQPVKKSTVLLISTFDDTKEIGQKMWTE